MKRTFALLMAIVMAISVVTIPVFAESKVVPPAGRDGLTLSQALNVEGGTIEFVSEGEYPFAVDGENHWAASTNQGVGSSASTVTATVTANEGEIVSFDYKVSTERTYDKFMFKIDGTTIATYSDVIDWSNFSYALTAGEHTLEWTYQKDSSVDRNDDTVWLDNVYVGAPVLSSEITVDENISVESGRMVQLVWNVLPANTFNKEVTFTSSDEGIATVNENGLVYGVAVGNAVITIETVDGGAAAECNVTVTEGLPPVVLYGSMGGNFMTFTDLSPNFTTVIDLNGLTIAAAEFAGGVVYGFNTSKQFFKMDFASKEVTMGAEAGNITIRDMAYDHSTQTLYALGINEENVRTLYTVDRLSGTLTAVAPVVCGSATPAALAISTDGTAYTLTESYGSDSRLYTVDLATGVGTLVGTTGLGLKREQSLAFDHNTGRLYWGRFSDYDVTGLTIVDPRTAAVTECGVIGNGGSIVGMFIENDLEVSDPGEETNPVVSFVDGLTNEIISTVEVERGYVLTEQDYPDAPVHEGYAFTGWDYNGAEIAANITVASMYFDLSMVSVTLRVIDEVMLDGSGFQMLLDADAVEYGNTILPGNTVFAYGAEGAVSEYALFEYKVPENADGDFMTEDDVVYYNESATNIIPAGVYDWCIVNPRYWSEDGPVIEYVSDIGSADGRNDDYSFEAGKSYIFTVYRYGELAAVDVEIIDYNPEPQPIEGDVDGNGVVEITDALMTLRYAMGIETLTDEQLAVADVNGDGTVDAADALVIMRWATILPTK